MKYEFRNPDIYLICGKAKHGKDTFSAYLKEVYESNSKKVVITQLSKYIKYYAREVTGWNLTEEDKPRELLQQLGTTLIRQQLNKENLFIDRIIEDIEVFSYMFDCIIISDVRLEKEIVDIKKKYPNAKVVHINRPDFDNGLTDEQKKHITEIGLDSFDGFDINIENTTLDKLKESAKKIYTERYK